VLTACPSGTQTPAAPAAKADVGTGTNVTKQLAADPATGTKAVTVTFGNVSTAGTVEIKTTTAPQPVPTGFKLSTGTVVFDVVTTAKFDKADLCFENDKVTAKSKLLHFTDSKWNDRTTTVQPPKICGAFPSFSPVAIVEEDPAAQASPTPTRTASPTPAPTATATPAATATATPTAAATATAAPTQAPATQAPATQAPATQAPVATVAPTPQPTVAPTPAPTPTPSPTPRVVANAPACPTTGLAICGTVVDASTNAPIAEACITLGPPIRCFTTTGGDGRYVINLTELAAQSGSTWDLYALRNTPEPRYAQVYSGTFVVSGVVTKDFRLTRQ
jgi:hypothetical protein